MQHARSTCTGWLLMAAASLGLTAACDDKDNPTASDASAITSDDAGGEDAASTSEDAGGEDAASAELPSGCERLVNDGDCDRTKRPIVFVHGTVANGDSFAHPALLLASNGYCADWIRAVEYHSLVAAPDAGADAGSTDAGSTDRGLDAGAGDGGAADASTDAARAPALSIDRAETYRRASADIDRVIDELRRDTGFDKVDLAGHSQGSGHGSTYAGMHPDRVAHYIHLAGVELKEDPGGVPTLCLSSTGDRPVNCATTKNVTFQDDQLDHSGEATTTEAAIDIYKFLNDEQDPKYTEIQCGEPIVLEGRAPTFADNTFLPGAKLEIYELGDAPRERGEPAASFTLTSNGNFGPFEAKRDVSYEFTLIPPPDDTTRRPSHAYMPPFKRSDRLLRFNFETKDPVASATSAQVNRDASFAVVIPRSLQKAFLFGRDSLKVNGREILTEATTWNAMTNHSTVTVAYYLYDESLTPGMYGPGDMQSTGESIISGFFVNSADMFFQAETPEWITVEYNGLTMKVPNWPSTTQGYSVVFVN
jgi:pimeloyl-ACP methyl ester carboxylesterase